MKRLLSLLAHASPGRHSPIFSATNRLLACVPIPEGCLRAPLQRHEDGLCCPLSNSPAELDGDCFCQFLCKAFPKKNEIQKGFAQPMYK